MDSLFQFDLTVAETLLFIVGGIATGIINTLAGSGSLITLPIFVFLCGLPAPVANGTNRIGVIFQTIVGVRGFKKMGITSFTGSTWLIVPSVAGAIVGSRIAVELNEKWMDYTLGALMVFMFFVLLLKPERWIRESEADTRRNRHPLSILSFFLIGVYGGFIQAGVGIFLLAALVLIGNYSLRAGNGIKLFIVLVFSLPALAVFLWYDQVHLGYGLAMAVFQSIGAWLGVRFVARVPDANVWIYRLLLAIVAVSAIKFFFKKRKFCAAPERYNYGTNPLCVQLVLDEVFYP
ncbi:MAG: sulfite exporter TauE/SafE family protein [Lewinellaceae bacterium]|nr:sulfite exporter TauE/SafE family protein [Lewinellaceae bacterium]